MDNIWYFSTSASGAYDKIKDCATRNQYEQIWEQIVKGARFIEYDVRMIGNRIDTCHGVAHEVELDRVWIVWTLFVYHYQINLKVSLVFFSDWFQIENTIQIHLSYNNFSWLPF